MEKYGVSDQAKLQREELAGVSKRLNEFEQDLEKKGSADYAQTVEHLRSRKLQLEEILKNQ